MLAFAFAVAAGLLVPVQLETADDQSGQSSQKLLALVGPSIIAPYCGQRTGEWGHQVQRAAMNMATTLGPPTFTMGLVEGQIDAIVWQLGLGNRNTVCSAAKGAAWDEMLKGADAAAASH